MRAAEYDRYGPPEVLSVREVPLPVPVRNQVRIRVHAAALNPKDLMTRAGKYRWIAGFRFPKRIGYDWAGEIDAVGPGVARERGQPLFGMIEAWSAGACAEYLIARESEFAIKPDTLSWEQAAAVPLTGMTALQALRDEAKLEAGQRLLINGASGGVGVAAIQIGKALGAHVTTLTSSANLTFVRELGADEALDYKQYDLRKESARYDVIFDAWGNHSFERVRHALSERGTYVTTVPRAGTIARQLLTVAARQRARLVVVHSRAADLEALAALISRGSLKPVVGQVFELDQLLAAQQALASKRMRGKLVIRI